MTWPAFITYVARIRHSWWGWFGVLITVLGAPSIRKRWRAPASVESKLKRMEQKAGGSEIPKLWAGMGYVFAAFGLILIIATGGQLVNEFLIHNLWNVWSLVAAFVMALGLYASGRWLIKQADQWILGPRYARDTVFFPEPEERLVSGP
jgi:drug/metabolite transporter (DMT)-like permease